MFRHRILLWSLAAFIAGVGLASFAVLPAWAGWAAVFMGAVLLLMRRPRMVVAGCVLLAAVAGAWRTGVAANHSSVLWAAAAEKPAVTVAGYVDGDFALTSSGRGKFPFRVLPENERIMVYGPEWVRPRYGQHLTLTGKLTQPSNSGEFDYVSYLAKEGAYAQMSFPSYGVPEGLRIDAWTRVRLSVGSSLRSIRYRADEVLQRAVGGPPAAYLAGILLGDRSRISPDLAEMFSRTGTSHVLAVSGYNITIVAAAIAALLGRFGRAKSYWLTVAGITAFTLMVGAGPSVVRAALMGILAVTAVRLRRKGESGMAILLAAGAMLVFNPLLLRWDVGFQLSFLAVLGIVYLEPLMCILAVRILRYEPLAALASTTVAAQIMVTPLLLATFGVFAVYTLPVNLIVLPLVPAAMALGAATALTGVLVPVLGSLVGQAAWLVASVQLAVIGQAALFPHAALEMPLSGAAMAACYAAIAAWLILRYRGRPVLTPNQEHPWQNGHSSSSNPTPFSGPSSAKSSAASSASA